MNVRIGIVLLALVCLGWFLTTTLTPPTSPPVAASLRSLPALPPEVAALSGSWEAVGPGDLPARLVVEDLRGNWAIVSFTWGDYPEGGFYKGWARVKAKVLPDGRLFLRHPEDVTFQLSEDWNTLLGTREQCGLTKTSVLRRVPRARARP